MFQHQFKNQFSKSILTNFKSVFCTSEPNIFLEWTRLTAEPPQNHQCLCIFQSTSGLLRQNRIDHVEGRTNRCSSPHCHHAGAFVFHRTCYFSDLLRRLHLLFSLLLFSLICNSNRNPKPPFFFKFHMPNVQILS